ncbi:MAG: heme ABC transporter ATP-binding protein, partial [Roseinatronobacter sp.]
GRAWLRGEALPLAGAGCDGQTRRAQRIAHVPEDRHRRGLVLNFHAWENVALGYHNDPAYNPTGWKMNNDAIRDDARAKIESFDVRPPDCWLKASGFSGGNQQKIVLAREIEHEPDLILIGQPTRGVDIGAIEFIHQRLIRLRDAGAAILLVSVELDEILALSDRILVMFDGRIMGERMPDATNAQELGLLMAGMS